MELSKGMGVSEEKIRMHTRRLLLARMRLLCNNGFYGLLLMHIKMSLDDVYDTAWTDGRERIYFHPLFLEKLSDAELEYVLEHELMHIVLQHSTRRGPRVEELFNQAADIVINSNILKSNQGNEESIYLREYGGVQQHKVTDQAGIKTGTVGAKTEGWEYTVEELYQLLYGIYLKKEQTDDCDLQISGAADSADVRDGKDNTTYAARGTWDVHPSQQEIDANKDADMDEQDAYESDYIWEQRLRQACEAIRQRERNKQRGMLPAFAERYMLELMKPQVDWRQILDAFVQEEIDDYSFEPPDRRMQDSPFFLPDYNEKTEHVRRILFMIDTSGSMSDEEITACYSEIKGAIDQYNGQLEGWLGFFDAEVTKPEPFADEAELLIMKPVGGGGTSFDAIFRYVREEMGEEPPASIVILTDGYAPFPAEQAAMDIPVLWIINNENITPPWGVIARIDLREI